jgi:hypothetical protein
MKNWEPLVISPTLTCLPGTHRYYYESAFNVLLASEDNLS